MKRLISFITVLFLSSCLVPDLKVYATEILDKELKTPYINARCAIAMDSKSKIVLYEKNSEMIVPMASTTKILTALIALSYGDLDKKVEISQRSANIRGSTVGYRKGESIKIRELVYGLMLRSGNDAAIAIAEGISGSVEEFLKLMNEYALQLGLLNSHFESPHGLDSENHYTTAYDLALITAKAKEIDEFNKIVASKDVDGASMGFTRSFHNINKILWQIPNADGVKTGFTGQAGKCLVSSVNHDGNEIIIIVLNCTPRWEETKDIYDYVSKKYVYKNILEEGELAAAYKINKGKQSVILKSQEKLVLPIKKDAAITKKVITPTENLIPMEKGEKVGSLEVYEDDKLIYTSPLCIDNSIKKKGFFQRLFQ